MVVGSLFFRTDCACDAVLLWFTSYYCVDKCFCAPLRAAAASDIHREPEAAPYVFLIRAPAPRGPTDGSTIASASTKRVPRRARRKARIADAKAA